MSQRQQANGNDSTETMLVIGGLLFLVLGLLYFFWVKNQEAIASVILAIVRAEALFLSPFYEPLGTLTHFPAVRARIESMRPAEVDLSVAYALLDLMGAYLRVVVVPLGVGLSSWIYASSVVVRYHRRLELDEVAKLHSQEFPYMAPLIGADLIKKNPDKGPYARARHPVVYSVEQGVLLAPNGKRLKRAPASPPTREKLLFDGERAREVLISQLGPLWSGVDDLPLLKRCLFAMLICRVMRDDGLYKAIRNEAGVSFRLPDKKSSSFLVSKKTVDLADEAIAKYADEKIVQRVVRRHAYTSVIFCELLELGRARSGIISTAEFIWLKPVDRVLFYGLNQAGRRVEWLEAAALRAHADAEKLVKRPLTKPFVDTAVRAWREILADETWIDKR